MNTFIREPRQDTTDPELPRVEAALNKAGSDSISARLLIICSAIIFALLSPVFYLNLWDFKRHIRARPFYTSKLVRLMDSHPILYEMAMCLVNFPARHRVYGVLPPMTGDILQVGCGTGLLNKYFRERSDLHFTNMDPNERALRLGYRLKRYRSFIKAYIDRPTSLPSNSYDVILFARSFHHVRNHRRAFEECIRLLRNDGIIVIADPVALRARDNGRMASGYMVNSSIDGVIWRFTKASLVEHLRECMPAELEIRSVHYSRPLHVSNFNMVEPQMDAVVILARREACS